MSKYAHKAKTLRIPKEFQPPQNYADRVSLMAVLSPVLRDEYEAHAREYGIPMSELILRCLSAWVEHQASAKENPIA